MAEPDDTLANDPRLALPKGVLHGSDGQPFQVPPEGALGLLALRWVGLRLWRGKRKEGGWELANPVRKKEVPGDAASDEALAPPVEAGR